MKNISPFSFSPTPKPFPKDDFRFSGIPVWNGNSSQDLCSKALFLLDSMGLENTLSHAIFQKR